MRGFLWCHGDMKRGKVKVSRESICMPKQEGGLGIRRLELFNIALMASHAWKILMCKESLWILQIRKHIRPFPWVRIGNGRNTSVFFDKWDIHCPLIDHLTPRIVSRAGLCLEDRVADLVHNASWTWPQDYAWDSIRAHSNEVPLFRVVCFSSSIPRHAFHLWLVMRKRLKTHDELKKKDVGNYVDLNLLRCPFFDFLPNILPIWDVTVNWISAMSKGKSVTSIVGRLLIDAS
ncbi:putative reverse transcriptase domain, reverse transcriptase zinc-binding domain protein [Tanacetum coccineum]|uniref:Reverse transcriptase domain, reverse transcriptase zinc-binding domain protein n=1 Tax=Tanacetum coccineum TaxID=301880 RepID=A0ABQ5EEY4_9ASTR